MKNKKIITSFLLGACGDALGAPLEGIYKLSSIKEKFGKDGLKDFIEFKNAYEKGVDYPAGRITDDTTMAMVTSLALQKAIDDEQSHDKKSFIDRFNYYAWQGYLLWAKAQHAVDYFSDKIDQNIQWPKDLEKLIFPVGAGKGTIAALKQMQKGTIVKPLDYTEVIEGKTIKSPNKGCGGMMRVVPIAFLENLSVADIFEITCENAAITHGDQSAYVASGIIALFIKNAQNDIDNVITDTQTTLAVFQNNQYFEDGIKQCKKIIDHVLEMDASSPSLETIDQLPEILGFKNKFEALPVLAQVTYALRVYQHTKNLEQTLILSANHSGDSDSVAAIVGNIIGANCDDRDIPQRWLNNLMLKDEIIDIANKLNRIQPKLKL